MRYLGGKHRIAKQIQDYINNAIIASGFDKYLEPFVGGANIISGINATICIASDLHEDLILLYNAVLSGWVPPNSLSEAEYKSLRHAPPSALRGFAGFGCSFAGKWFGGYARSNTKQDYCKCAKNLLLKKFKQMACRTFLNRSYDSFNVEGYVIYCDPPYQNTTGYSTGTFDHTKFWQWVRDMSQKNIVIVSEYTAPEDFECVLEIETKTDIRTKEGQVKRIEKLFRLKTSI